MMPSMPSMPSIVNFNQGDPTDFLNRLASYDQSEGTDTLLDLLREIIYSGNYYWVGASFPYGTLVNVPANGTVNGSVALPPGTYITSITYYSDANPVAGVNPQGFKFVLYDKGTKAPIVYGSYIRERLIGSDMVLQNMSGIVPGEPYGPAYLTSPFIVTPPGVINWEIVNLSPVAAMIQMMLSCAVPISNSSIGTRRIQK